jgi:hypothetical protein
MFLFCSLTFNDLNSYIVKVNRKSTKLLQFVTFLNDDQPLLTIKLGAGAASRCGSSSTKMMRFLAAAVWLRNTCRQVFLTKFSNVVK